MGIQKFNIDLMFDTFCSHFAQQFVRFSIDYPQKPNGISMQMRIHVQWYHSTFTHIWKKNNPAISIGFISVQLCVCARTQFSQTVDTWFDMPSLDVTKFICIGVYLNFALAHFHSRKQKIIFILWLMNSIHDIFQQVNSLCNLFIISLIFSHFIHPHTAIYTNSL